MNEGNYKKYPTERALTAAEEADKTQAIIRQRLAEAVNAYVTRLVEIALDDQDALQGGPPTAVCKPTPYARPRSFWVERCWLISNGDD